MLTLTTNLAVWMSAVTDESVHKAHSKLKKNMTDELYRWFLRGKLSIYEASQSREGHPEVESGFASQILSLFRRVELKIPLTELAH